MITKKIIGIVVGAAIGFLITYLVRCSSSGGVTWGITSNPWSGIILGALFGYLLMPE